MYTIITFLFLYTFRLWRDVTDENLSIIIIFFYGYTLYILVNSFLLVFMIMARKIKTI